MNIVSAIIVTFAFFNLAKSFKENVYGIEEEEEQLESENCTAYKKKYIDALSKAFDCILENSRPIKLCSKCVHYYEDFESLFYEIADDNTCQIKSIYDDCCKDLLFSADRIQVLYKTGNYLKTIWENSYCRTCYSYVKDNKTAIFYDFYKNITSLASESLQCLVNFTNYSLDMDEEIPHDQKNDSYWFNRTACHICRPIYKETLQFFNQIMTNSSKHVCMDVQDTMNFTSHLWGSKETFDCSFFTKGWRVFIAIAMGYFLTVFFYVAARVNSSGVVKKVFQPQRLKIVIGSDSSTSSNETNQEPS